jgi:uncharacterized protein (DUF427 family)
VWEYRGQARPAFAVEPGPGQESVWDYPRPPVLEQDQRRVVVRVGALTIADTRGALRILETASPPTFYLPPDDVRDDLLVASAQSSWCEWKGAARYFDLVAGPSRRQNVAWSYPQPTPAFSAIAGHYSFYPGRVECYVDDERVRPQPGGFYGGWLTADIVGPCKGEPGTGGW